MEQADAITAVVIAGMATTGGLLLTCYAIWHERQPGGREAACEE